MRYRCVAVEWGAATVRVAGVEAGGPPRVLAQWPAGPTPDRVPGPFDVGSGRGPGGVLEPWSCDHLVLLHPVDRPAGGVGRVDTPFVGRVHTVAAAVAAAGATGTWVVFDVGRTGAGATLVREGAVVTHRRCGVGGDRLDEVVLGVLGAMPWPEVPVREAQARRAQVRHLRETLSLQSTAVTGPLGGPGAVRLGTGELRAALTPPLREAVAVLRGVVDAAGGSVPVLLVGGVARTPLLAELVDDAGIEGAVVAPHPEAAAVLGALSLPFPEPAPRSPTAVPAVPHRWLPPLPDRRRRTGQVAVASLAAAATVTGLLVAGSALVPAAAPAVPGELPSSGFPVPSGVLVQYGYRLDLPPGWEHTGGLPERRRILLTPASAPQGSDLIAVERTPLGYDTAAEPNRAGAELKAEFDAAIAGGSPLSDYEPGVRTAGRDVTTYRQGAGETVVEWFVVLDGDAQLSVGCRYTPAGADAVRAACAVVVASVRRA